MSIGKNQPYSFMFSGDVLIDWVSWFDDYIMNSSNVGSKLWILDWICLVNLCWNVINVLSIGSYRLDNVGTILRSNIHIIFRFVIKFHEYWKYTLWVRNPKSVSYGLWILIGILCSTKYDYMSSSCYVFRKGAYVLTEATTEHFRVMTIVVAVVMWFIAMMW